MTGAAASDPASTPAIAGPSGGTDDDFLTDAEIAALRFARVGKGVRLSRRALVLRPGRIVIGDHTRIDAFCILSASADGIAIGRYVHLSAYTSILGRAKVEIGDYCTVSVRCSIFTSNDDYSGLSATNPTLPDDIRNVDNRPVRILSHAIIGASAVILPGVVVGESAAVGAFSLVKESVPPFAVAAGVPARIIGAREARHRSLVEREAARLGDR